MAALDFPSSPTLNQVFQSWQWDGTKWVAVAGGFASGTVMLFYQGAAPSGWTQVTTQNDKLLRVTSGSGGVAGGTNPFSTVNAQTTVGSHTLALAEIPQLTSYMQNANTGLFAPLSTGAWSATVVSGGSGYYASTTGGSLTYASYAQTQTSVTQGLGHNHPITLAIAYCDLILASKN